MTLASGDIWIGMMNRDMAYCYDNQGHSCDGIMYWIDGEEIVYKQSWMEAFDANDRVSCVRMLSHGGIGDKECGILLKFVCQYHCDNVYKGILTGSFFMFTWKPVLWVLMLIFYIYFTKSTYSITQLVLK